MNDQTKNPLPEEQEKHRQMMKDKRDAIKERKARAHRLIERGAIAEGLFPNAQDMTNEEFQRALYEACFADLLRPNKPP